MAFQSAADELVSRRSEQLLAAVLQVELHLLQNSGHYHIDPTDKIWLLKHFSRFMEENLLS